MQTSKNALYKLQLVRGASVSGPDQPPYESHIIKQHKPEVNDAQLINCGSHVRLLNGALDRRTTADDCHSQFQGATNQATVVWPVVRLRNCGSLFGNLL